MIATKITGLPTSPQNQQNPIKNVELQEKKSNQQQQQEHNNETRSEKLPAANIGQQQQQAGDQIACLPTKQEVIMNQPAPTASTKIQLKQQKFLAAAAKCSTPAISSLSTVVSANKRTAVNIVAPAQDQHQAPRTLVGSSEQRRCRADEPGATQLADVVTTPLSVAGQLTSLTAAEGTNATATSTTTAANAREPVVAQGLLQQAPMSTNSSSAPASTHSQRSQQQQARAVAVAAATSTHSPAATAEASALSQRQKPQQQTADAQILIESSERRADFVPSKTQTTVVSAELEGERRQRVRIGGSIKTERTGNENDEAQQPSQRERLHNLNISNYNYNQNHHHHHHHNHHQHQHHYNNNNNHHHHHQHNHHQHQHQNQNQLNHHQQQQNQHQHTMAHYKFHNDCQSSVLTYEQVKRLDFVMDQIVPIHGRGNFPTLYVKLKELIRLVKHKLQTEHSIEIRDVRLNGGAASFVLAPENSHYNDLDLIFGTDLSNEDQFDVIRDVVLECLKEFYPKEQQQHQQHQQEEHYFDSESFRETKIDVVRGGGRNSGETNNCSTNLANNRASSMFCHSSGSNLKSTMNESDSDENDRIEDSDEDVENDDGVDGNRRVEKRLTGSRGSIQNKTSAREYKSIEGSANSKGENQRSPQLMQNFQYQHQSYQMPLNNCAIKEAYVHKMVKVNDDDRWSLISLGVQQSEASCCASKSAIITTTNSNKSNNNCPAMHHVVCRQQHYQQTQHQQQITACVTTNENEPRSGLINQSSAHMVSNENSLNAQTIVMSSTQQQLYQPSTNYIHQQNQRDHYQTRPKQFPNSIELKFVDRMRRKFEFSVDSFQIILDSLLQFYDYAPQSTITSQRKLINSHPSSTMINIRPMINRKRCNACCVNRTVLGCKIHNSNLGSLSKASTHRENHNNHHHHHHTHTNQNHSQQQQANNGFSETKPCNSILNGSRGYYQLPIDSENSPSISSVASSSGCSSSSSVVSSSSSSLSCDEDHEDLYCDADCPSTSASTSSLLSSTNSSSLSADGSPNDVPVVRTSCLNENICNQDPVSPDQAETSDQNRLVHHQNQSSNKGHSNKNSLNGNLCRKSKSINVDFDRMPTSSEANSVECIEYFNQQQNLISDVYHFEMNNRTSCAVISENFYPTVIGRSEYGNFKEALYHLEKKLIATRSPEEIRGGGLLKYCNLLVKNYKPTNVYQIRTLERYMCSRFFIDFSDLNQQQAKLESYLANHFSDDPVLKFDYLTILHNVVQRSTVCLMNHELRLTLNMIRDLAYKLNEQQQHQNQQHQHQNHQQQQQHQHQQQQQHQHQNHLQHQQQLSTTQQLQQPTDFVQAQPNQHHYYQQKPVLIQSGVYRVKLVNYALAKAVRP